MSRDATGRAVRVGVVGLGRPWLDRCRPLLTRPGGPTRVVAVCDPVVHRAEAEADRLSCAAAEGVTALLDREDVEAVFLLDDPWFGPWPLRPALERGKAVYCGAGPSSAIAELAAMPAEARRAAPPVMVELTRRFAPETARLRELFATEIGPPTHARAEIRIRAVGGDGGDRVADAAAGLLDWCCSLFGRDPADARVVRRVGDGAGGDGLRIAALAFPGGGTARVALRLVAESRADGGEGDPSCRLAVRSAHGRARIDRPGLLRWSAAGTAGKAEATFPTGLPTESLVEYFLRAVRGEATMAPSIDELVALDRMRRLLAS